MLYLLSINYSIILIFQSPAFFLFRNLLFFSTNFLFKIFFIGLNMITSQISWNLHMHPSALPFLYIYFESNQSVTLYFWQFRPFINIFWQLHLAVILWISLYLCSKHLFDRRFSIDLMITTLMEAKTRRAWIDGII